MSAHRDRQNVLWVSAIALVAAILIVAGRSPMGAEPAMAISNDRVGDMTVVTIDEGNEHDIVIVLDRVQGMALVYSAQNRQSLELLQAEPIERLFSLARAYASSQRTNP